MATDYYALLKIRRDAAQDEVKRAYRRLAREMHPDVNPDPETQERFKEITQAYEVLSDTDKRRMYDMGQDPYPKEGGEPSGGYDFWDEDFARCFREHSRAAMAEATPEGLYTALCTNVDGRTAEALIDQGVVPNQETLRYVVNLFGWAGWTKRLTDAGAKPTSDMLYTALCVNLDSATADVLLKAGAESDEKTLSHAKAEGWQDWEEKLTASMRHDPRIEPSRPAAARPMI